MLNVGKRQKIWDHLYHNSNEFELCSLRDRSSLKDFYVLIKCSHEVIVNLQAIVRNNTDKPCTLYPVLKKF